MADSGGLIYSAWDSLYTAYLYDMMYKGQACRMCKEKNDGTRLTPLQVDNRIKQLMSTVKTKPQTPTNNEQIQTPARYRGYKTQRASFLRRLAADIVDQLFVSFILIVSINSFDVVVSDIIEKISDSSEILFSKKGLLNMTFLQVDDLEIFHILFMLSVSSIIIRLFVSVYEWLSIWLYGTTIGKLMAGLFVVECIEVTSEMRDDIIIVNPGTKVGCYSSLKRSVVKNVLRHFIPLILCFITTKGGRTLYDEATKTAVVYERALWEPNMIQ